MADAGTRRRVGQLRQGPNGRWRASIESGTKIDGSRRTTSKTFDTKAQAESWLLTKSLELERRPDMAAGITLRSVWHAYAKAQGERLAKKTLASYRWHMEGAKDGVAESWLDMIGDMDISTITPSIVQGRLDTMPRQKAMHAKGALSAVLSWAVQKGLLARNPLRGHVFTYRDDPLDEDPFSEDPFAAIEDIRDVWGIDAVARCFELIRGLPLEPAWLACVGAGLRVEEALALRKMDVRRISIGGRMVTQLAVHAARTDMDDRKTTKTKQSKRIVAMIEPLGERYWEIAQAVGERDELVCPVSAQNQNKRWRGYFEPKSTAVHAPKKRENNHKGALRHKDLPYLPLSKMRNTHVTIMAEAGVSDSINALMHGHTVMVERTNYLSPDFTTAAARASEHLRLVG